MTFWNLFFLILIYVPLIMLWIFALSDLARRADLSGVAKGLWAVAVVLLPLIGMLIYFITRPDTADMGPTAEAKYRELQAAELTEERLAEIEKLSTLRDSGALTDEEFAAMKAKILG